MESSLTTVASPPTASPLGMFSSATSKGQDMELIPHGTLAWCLITVRGIKDSKEPREDGGRGRYLDIELTVGDGPYTNKKLWDRIMDPTHIGNSEKGRAMGITAVTRCLETSGFFVVGKPESYDRLQPEVETQQRHPETRVGIEAIGRALDGQRCAIKIKLEKGKDGFADKNCVGEWLSPNPESGSHKFYKDLVAGVVSPVVASATAFKSPLTIASSPAVATGHEPATPSWLSPKA